MNNYVFPIRSSGELDFAKPDGTIEKLTFRSKGIFMDPQGFKGLPMQSKASMVFIGMDGAEKEVTFGNNGFQLFSNNDDLNKIFAEFTAKFMNAYAPTKVASTGTEYY